MSGTGEVVVECPVHGPQGPAYVCRHLNLRDPVGFVEGCDPARPDEDLFQAWCTACDQVLQKEGEWNDRSEASAGIRMVCRACYRVMRSLSRRRR